MRKKVEPSRSLKIYIAGPYTAKTERKRVSNVNKAIDAALSLLAKGHFPYVPHLTHFVNERARVLHYPMRWADFMEWDLQWLSVCDALLFLGESKGANLELYYAKNLRKRVFYFLDEIPVVPVTRIVKCP